MLIPAVSVKNLLERNLIKIMGQAEYVPGRPFLLGTTKRFLEVFGLEKLSDMPTLKDFDNLDESKLPTILKIQTFRQDAG